MEKLLKGLFEKKAKKPSSSPSTTAVREALKAQGVPVEKVNETDLRRKLNEQVSLDK